MAKLNEYLTVGEAAELLGVSKDTLRRWDRAGIINSRWQPMTSDRPYAIHLHDLQLHAVNRLRGRKVAFL